MNKIHKTKIKTKLCYYIDSDDPDLKNMFNKHENLEDIIINIADAKICKKVKFHVMNWNDKNQIDYYNKVKKRFIRLLKYYLYPNKKIILKDKINIFLREKWNPIGTFVPKDEYISYVPRIYELLEQNCDVFYLTQTLEHISNKIIGLETDWHKTLKIAELLINEFQEEIIYINQNIVWERNYF